MREKKWSKAPWRQATRGPNQCPVIGSGAVMVAMLAHSAEVPDQRETAEANASLIESAPDLVEALEDLIGLAETAMGEANRDGAEYDIEGELEDARAALAKAYGDDQ